MKILVGIDEAGYGPTLGPLVLGFTAFRVPDDESRLFQRLRPLICRKPTASGRRLPIDDSKKLYAGRRDLGALELTCLSFLHPGKVRPTRLENVASGPDRDPSRWAPWYQASTSDPLPQDVEAEPLDAWRERLATELPGRDVEPLACEAIPVLEPRFNRLVDRTGNKAAALLSFLAPLIRNVVTHHPGTDVELRVDRLGGRRYYESFLGSLFPLKPMRILREGPARSAYVIRDGSRNVELHFETQSDARHLPVALSSMCAKYVRELFLRRLNRYFAERVPGLKPTAGYPGDAARFLQDVAPVLPPKERTELVRQC